MYIPLVGALCSPLVCFSRQIDSTFAQNWNKNYAFRITKCDI